MKKRLLVAIFILSIILIPLLYINFFVISSTGAKKPVLEKPMISDFSSEEDEEQKSEAISYMANEIGAYKLHDDPISGEIPEIEFQITDTNEYYSVIIDEGIPYTNPGRAVDPDIRIRCSMLTMDEIIAAEDIQDKLVEIFSANRLALEILTDQKTLAMKGYKGIYDTLAKKSGNTITGNAFLEINPLEMIGGIRLAFLFVFFLILELCFLYERCG